MKNITVSVDDETYRRARTKAAEQDTSLSALVRRFLVELVSEESTERGLERAGARPARANPRLLRRRSLIAGGRASSAANDAALPRYQYPALFHQPRSDRDQQSAIALSRSSMRGGNALSVQVLQEFYVQATRATRRDALPHDIAAGLIRTWLRFKVQETSVSIITGALEIKAVHGLSYWDAAIVAAARALGCRELYSEDMTHGREIEHVKIINPFR